MNFEPVPTYARQRASAATDAGLTRFFWATYAWMASGLAVSAVTAWLVAYTPAVRQVVFGSGPIMIGLFIAQIAMVMVFSRKVATVSAATAGGLFLGYSLLSGITLSSLFLVYAQGTLFQAFGVSAASFGGLAFYGAVTKRDLTPVGSFMHVGLIGLIVASVVNMFLHSPAVAWISTYVGVLIFAGLTAYDNQRLRQMYSATRGAGNLAINGALMLYLDFINLFLFILRIFSDRR